MVSTATDDGGREDAISLSLERGRWECVCELEVCVCVEVCALLRRVKGVFAVAVMENREREGERCRDG